MFQLYYQIISYIINSYENSAIIDKQVLDVRDPPPSGQCQNTMAYIADVQSFSILVFDLKRQHSWRVQNKLFFPCPAYGTYTIAGESFDLMDGVLGMALSPRNSYAGKTFGIDKFRPHLPFGPQGQADNRFDSIISFHYSFISFKDKTVCIVKVYICL